MRIPIAVFMVIRLLAGPVSAEEDKPGEFDYYVLALSWSPSWCAIEGDARDADQCEEQHDYGFTLHGLWPQFEKGWPSFCPTVEAAPSRAMTASMSDIMGSSGLAWYQWKKHGRCSGLSAKDYYDAARKAYASIARPAIFRQIDRTFSIKATLVEEAFLKDNPTLSAGMLAVTCKEGYFQEVRVCLNKALEPRICARDIRRDCQQIVKFPPVR